MIEVDNVRRNYNIGGYEPNFLAPTHPLGASLGPPHYDSHRVLVHWNQPGHALPHPSQTSGARSDEDDEGDDDEDRPFTPPPPRERLSYTRYQLELLNGIYEEVRYPNSTQKQLIAKRVGITREQVKIWFQNRRRKDVIGLNGKSGKPDKTCDTSTCSTTSSGSSKDSGSRQSSPATPDSSEGNSSGEESSSNNSIKEETESVVPNVVMKSVINELVKFKNDPLKGKKNRKKKSKSSKQKEKVAIKKGLTATLLTGSYDMINPPNQITPTAFFDKVKSGFNHSKNSSAFASPREATKPAQISSISSTTGSPPTCSTSMTVSTIPGRLPGNHSAYPFPGQGHFLPPRGINSNFPPALSTTGPDMPVLSDLLTGKGSSQQCLKDKSVSQNTTSNLSPPMSPAVHPQGRDIDRNFPSHPGLPTFSPGRPLNGIYPYPFVAEQPMLLSSLRQSDHVLRPAPQYPLSHFTDDPYQPLFISSLSNPYYSGAWPSSNPAAQGSGPVFTSL